MPRLKVSLTSDLFFVRFSADVAFIQCAYHTYMWCRPYTFNQIKKCKMAGKTTTAKVCISSLWFSDEAKSAGVNQKQIVPLVRRFRAKFSYNNTVFNQIIDERFFFNPNFTTFRIL